MIESKYEHTEHHRSDRVGWLRAAVLGANDGIVSTASLIVGVAAADASRSSIVLAGVAGMVAGAMSMAAGEYVSVSSQADTESADLDKERGELEKNPERELDELTQIYVQRGLDANLARQVAVQLSEHDALGTHARDEIGISETITARPIQAALASAASFAVGAIVPIIVVLVSPSGGLVWVVFGVTVLLLAALGATASWIGGSRMHVGAIRVTFWGILAMAATALVGRLFGVAGL
ncbi:VIT1/CCC1 transporter family protein [Planctomycetes bacterium TBK1r]|uniref:VIT family protein n=1 Tax=Stieleria magnilauensis TaxID=2527963 RepID=A0ABX5XXN2_9BACT|nr:VIT family protein [Planctomycetes bacterium TBK1r]